jgi:3-carboxy-cis,cis-muconate cycloisomerase
MVLTSRAALEHLETKLEAVIARLIPLAESHRDMPMAGRTRFQQAVPITFGLRVAGWIAPLLRHLDRLGELRARLLVVQLGGAAGTLCALGGKGAALTEALARELGLGVPLGPWHSQRDTIAELGAWLALLAGTMAKLGMDTVLLSQTEIGELAEGGDGHGVSSTMPQKANPILGEALISIGRLAAGQLTGIHTALVHAGERDGSAWQMEWLALPELFALAGAALGNGEKLAGGLRVNGARMDMNLKASGGLILAEAAAFTLAKRMPLAEAQGIVAEAAKAAVENHENLIETLAARLDDASVLDGLDDMFSQTGESGAVIDRVLAAAKARIGV